MTTAAEYAQRAPWYAVETATVPIPELLGGALRRARECDTTVAEVPCAAGHFLTSYANADVPVLLLDAEPAMLRYAHERAVAAGVNVVAAQPHILGTHRDLSAVGAVVVPNAALNYLAATVGTTRTINALAMLVAPGAELLLQYIGVAENGVPDRSGSYDPAWPHGRWVSEWTRPDGLGGNMTRRRLQRRRADRIEVRFEHSHDGDALRSAISMLVMPAERLRRLLVARGLTVTAAHRQRGRLSEMLAIRPDGDGGA
jgi:SAM-dependent methyltransferase